MEKCATPGFHKENMRRATTFSAEGHWMQKIQKTISAFIMQNMGW